MESPIRPSSRDVYRVTPETPGDRPRSRQPPDPSMVAFLHRMWEQFIRMQMEHQFAVEEVLTKVSILRQEFLHLHRYNPIEHVSSRVKSPPASWTRPCAAASS